MFDFILVCGDLHGSLDHVPNYLKKHQIKNSAIIVAGDFGVGFETKLKETKRLNYLSKRLNEHNNIIYGVRGNHDDPAYFSGEFDTNNVKLVPDYSTLQLNNIRILCVGGATSIDRTVRNAYRGRGRDYWKKELYVHDIEKLNNVKDINVVVTHSSPHFVFPYSKRGIDYWLHKDPHLIADTKKERNDIAHLYSYLTSNEHPLTNWYYGHFHDSNIQIYEKVKFTALDIGEIVEIKLYEIKY